MKYLVALTLCLFSFNILANDSTVKQIGDLKIYCSTDDKAIKSCSMFAYGLIIERKNDLFYIDTYHAHAPRFLISLQIDDNEVLKGFPWLNRPNREAIAQMKTGKNITITDVEAIKGSSTYTVSLEGFNATLDELIKSYDEYVGK